MGFDLVTHRRNKKGQITSTSPYRLIIENGVQMFERPPKSGIFYGANGEIVKAPAGYKKEETISASELSEKLAKENEELKAKLEALEKSQAESKIDSVVEEEKQKKVNITPSYIKK